MSKSWKDCQEWIKCGLPLTTTSNEACRLYDAVLSQMVAYHNDNSVGGIAESSKKLLESDPEFVMGKVLLLGSALVSHSKNARIDVEFQADIDNLVRLANTVENLTPREKNHVEAVRLWKEGYIDDACLLWEDILIDHPTDMMAIQHALYSYYQTGHRVELRDSIARVVPHWDPKHEQYGYLLGKYAFGLEECGLYTKAEEMAVKALEIHPTDAFANHARAHVFEMTGRFDEGISKMEANLADWSESFISCHSFWHLAVFYIEKGDFQSALDLYDSEVFKRCRQAADNISISDAVSMLYRLEFEGIDVGNRWNELFETTKTKIHDHLNVFFDVHTFGSCVRAKHPQEAGEMMTSMKEFIENGSGQCRDLLESMGFKMCEALQAYDAENYAKTIELLYPIRYKLHKTGGSNAQRDVFNLLLIQAAMKSPVPKHQRLARQLLIERKSLKENSPLTDRLNVKLG